MLAVRQVADCLLAPWPAELDTDEAQPSPSEEQVRRTPTNAQGSGE